MWAGRRGERPRTHHGAPDLGQPADGQGVERLGERPAGWVRRVLPGSVHPHEKLEPPAVLARGHGGVGPDRLFARRGVGEAQLQVLPDGQAEGVGGRWEGEAEDTGGLADADLAHEPG